MLFVYSLSAYQIEYLGPYGIQDLLAHHLVYGAAPAVAVGQGLALEGEDTQN